MKTDSLELDDDPELELKLRPYQMVLKWALVGFVIAAALGFFGKSDLTVKEVQIGNSSFRYPRVVRQQTADDLTFEIAGPFNGLASVWITQDYLKDGDIDHINPLPVKTETVGKKVRFDFAANGVESMHVILSLKPRSAGF